MSLVIVQLYLILFVIFQTYYNAAMFKARTKIRAKHRDKRSANLTGD